MQWRRALGRGLFDLANLALAGLLALQLFLIVVLREKGEVPLPDSVLSMLDEQLAEQGLRVESRELHFDLRGMVLASEVKAYSTENSEPFFHADQLLARFSPLRALWGDFLPTEIILANAGLDCPAVASPSGQPEPVISGLYVDARRHSDRWELNTLLLEILGVKVTASGHCYTPIPGIAADRSSTPQETSAPEKSAGWVAHYIGACREILNLREQFKCAEEPIVRLSFNGDRSSPLQAEVQAFNAGYFDEPSQVRLGASSARLRAIFGEDGVLRADGLGRVRFDSLEWADHAKTGYMQTSVKLGDGLKGLIGLPEKVQLYAYNIEAWGLPFDGVFANLDLRGLQQENGTLNGRVALKSARHWLTVEGPFRPSDQSAQWKFEARWNPEFFFQTAAIPAGTIPEGLEFLGKPHWRGSVDIQPGFTFGSADVAVVLGPVRYDKIHLLDALVVGRVTETGLTLSNVQLQGEDYAVSGSYEQDFASNDYRFRAEGTVWPLDLDIAIEDAWWHDLWSAVAFHDGPPAAQIDMSGRFGADGLDNRIFGRASLGSATYLGVPVKSASAHIWQTPEHLDLFDFQLATPQGRSQVNLHWRYLPQSSDHVFLSFQGRTHMPLAQAATLVDAGIEDYAALFPTKVVPELDLAGLVYGDHAPNAGAVYFKSDVFFPGPFEFEDVRFDDGTFTCLLDPDWIKVTGARLGLGGGVAALETSVRRQQDGQLAVQEAQLVMQSGRLAQLYEAIPFLRQSREKQANATNTQPPPLTDERYAGIVDLLFFTRGQLPDLNTFVGRGKIWVKQARLGQLHLLGGLSRWMDSIGLGIGTLNFDAASSDFTLARGNLNFNDAKITGSTGLIDANGNFNINNERLDLLVSLHPLGNMRMPVVSQLFSVFSPIADSLEVKVTGTLTEPIYNTSVKPFAVFTGQTMIDNPNEGLVDEDLGPTQPKP